MDVPKSAASEASRRQTRQSDAEDHSKRLQRRATRSQRSILLAVQGKKRRQAVTAGLQKDAKKLRGGEAMRKYLADLRTEPREVVLPFSCPQVGIYYDVLLTGTEAVRRKKALDLAALEYKKETRTHSPAFIAGAAAADSYASFRRHQQALPLQKTLARASESTLVRCPTPPPAEHMITSRPNSDSSDTSEEGRPDEHEAPESFLLVSVQKALGQENLLSPEDAVPSVLEFDGTVRGLARRTPEFTHEDGYRMPAKYTPTMTDFAVAVEAGLRNAKESPEFRSRIRLRRQPMRDPPAESIPFPQLPYDSSNINDLVDPMEERFIFHNAWVSRGIHSDTATALTLQQAWDIGKGGCYARLTINPSSFSGTSHLCFFIMDGTSDAPCGCRGLWPTKQLLNSCSSSICTECCCRTLTAAGSCVDSDISWLELQDAHWVKITRSIRFTVETGEDMIIEELSEPFFAAVLVYVRFNYSLRILHQIRQRRHLLRRFELQEGYLKALRGMFQRARLLMFLDQEEEEEEAGGRDKNEEEAGGSAEP